VSKKLQIIFIKFYIHEGFPKITRACLYSPLVFSFDLNKISAKKCSIFNNLFTTCQNIMKSTQYNTTQWKLSNNTKSVTKKKTLWFGDFNVTNKTNKLPSFIFWSDFSNSSTKWKTFCPDNLELNLEPRLELAWNQTIHEH
jgi:hypothetical protein